MSVEITAIAAVVAIVAPSALALVAGVLGGRLARRLGALERRLEIADERFEVLAATLGEELGALREVETGGARELGRLAREIERLAADVVQRELYRGGAPSHSGAIDAVRGGQNARSLVREYGLSLDEAELLVSLHGGGAAAAAATIANRG